MDPLGSMRMSTDSGVTLSDGGHPSITPPNEKSEVNSLLTNDAHSMQHGLSISQ